MDEKIMEKLKDEEFVKKIIMMADKAQVVEEFKKSGIEVDDKDLEELRDLVKGSEEVVSSLSSEELEHISAGYEDGFVASLSQDLRRWAAGKRLSSPNGSFSVAFYDKLEDHSDKVIEAGLATALVGGTLGVKKLVDKGFFTKDFWINKK